MQMYVVVEGKKKNNADFCLCCSVFRNLGLDIGRLTKDHHQVNKPACCFNVVAVWRIYSHTEDRIFVVLIFCFKVDTGYYRIRLIFRSCC